MSRTYRRKNETKDLWWVITDYTYIRPLCMFIRYRMSDAEAKVALAKYHSDAYRGFREPGPRWYRNLTAERPQRREAVRQLREYMKDSEFVVILPPKNKLKYWT